MTTKDYLLLLFLPFQGRCGAPDDESCGDDVDGHRHRYEDAGHGEKNHRRHVYCDEQTSFLDPAAAHLQQQSNEAKTPKGWEMRTL